MNLPLIRDNPIFYLGLLVTIEEGISGGTVKLAHAIPDSWIPTVDAWASILAFCGTAIMTGLAAPMGKPPTQMVAKVLAWLIMPLAIVLLMGGPTGAQGQPKRAPAQTDRIGGPVGKVLDKIEGQPQGSNEATQGPDLSSGGLSGLKNPLASVLQDLANFIGKDNAGAIALATQIPTLQDLNGKACWMAFSETGAVFEAHPVPLTFRVMSDIQANRLLVWSTYKLCHNTACGIVFNDLRNGATQAGGGLIAVPDVLGQICGRIAELAPQLPAAALPPEVTAPPATPTQP